MKVPPINAAGTMKLERLENFPLANLRFVPLLDDSLGSFQIRQETLNPNGPSPFCFTYALRAPPGFAASKKTKVPIPHLTSPPYSPKSFM
jgi:hypothetical protein